jgi:(S)-2-hydroxyglutarate dehydrogenase
MREADVTIIGAGIVGLATAYQLMRRFPRLRIVILEKESGLALHQTGRNSGVLHSGIYYKPGSLKAVNCRAGKRAMEEFCAAEKIPFEICGKVIVALSEEELPALAMIFDRGQANGVRCTMIDVPRLKELEPHAAGIRAIHVPETGIVDYRAVCGRLAERIRETGDNEIVFSARVVSMERRNGGMVLATAAGDVATRYVVNCAGLQSDRVAALSGQRPEAKIVPFRGEYYELAPEARRLVKNLIYPVPNPAFPFLGVHFTRMIDGSVECGPNAVFAFGREAYRKTDVNLRDLFESLTYPGFIRLVAKYWRIGSGEMWRSLSKRAFVRALQRLVPDIRSDDLHPAPSGIRAQAIARDGAMVDDFLIQETDIVVNVCNAPSPAATASLNIGALITDTLARRF